VKRGGGWRRWWPVGVEAEKRRAGRTGGLHEGYCGMAEMAIVGTVGGVVKVEALELPFGNSGVLQRNMPF
jgi:hypothetical protein